MILDVKDRFKQAAIRIRQSADKNNLDDDDFGDEMWRAFMLYVVEFIQSWVDGLLNIGDKRGSDA